MLLLVKVKLPIAYSIVWEGGYPTFLKNVPCQVETQHKSLKDKIKKRSKIRAGSEADSSTHLDKFPFTIQHWKSYQHKSVTGQHKQNFEGLL